MLAVICSQFPEMHETFVIRELNALREAGMPMKIYSLKKCRDRIRHKEADPLMPLVRYAAWNDMRVWVLALFQFVLHPVKAGRNLIWVITQHRGGAELLKGLVVWVQCMAMAREMQAEGVKHVHAHWATMPTTAAICLSKWLSVPFSFTAHAWDIFVKNRSLKEKVSLSKSVLTCTDFNRKHLMEMCPGQKEKIILNYHGVDVQKFADVKRRSADEGMQLFLSVGRFVEQKGYSVLTEAYAALNKAGARFRAVIVGDGPGKTEIKKMIKTHGLQDRVELCTSLSQDELRELYRSAYAFVLPCRIASNGDRDGIPNVILEAMAMGLPVISTNISGVPEAVVNGETGLISMPGDEADLAKVLEEALGDPDRMQQLGQGARRKAEEIFDARIHMKALVETMSDIVSVSDEIEELNTAGEDAGRVQSKIAAKQAKLI